ncbi:MAG: hypothetical protein JWP74_1511 [Marmoricola sp.]|nr:hypothetical protein [Marmoricola sp.]
MKTKKYLNRLKKVGRWVKKIRKLTAAWYSATLRELALLWEDHVDRMLGEIAYAQAIRDLLQITVGLFKPNYLARFVADQILTTYMALLRLFRPPVHLDDDGLSWA